MLAFLFFSFFRLYYFCMSCSCHTRWRYSSSSSSPFFTFKRKCNVNFEKYTFWFKYEENWLENWTTRCGKQAQSIFYYGKLSTANVNIIRPNVIFMDFPWFSSTWGWLAQRMIFQFSFCVSEPICYLIPCYNLWPSIINFS